MKWDQEVDFLIVGSGAGGLTAALTAHAAGLKTLVVEKAPYYGGSSARSGGGLWIPNNHLMKAAGIADTFEEAAAYMQATVGDRVPWPKQQMFLQLAPVMLLWLENNTGMRCRYMLGYADYYPEKPGGKAEGRSVEPLPFDLRLLGEERHRLNPPAVPTRGLAIQAREYKDLTLVTRTFRGVRTALRVGLRFVGDTLLGRETATMGQALIARLRYTMMLWGIPLWLETPLEDLVLEGGRVVGAVVRRQGKTMRIAARRGVLLAAGGFARNQAMRERYLPHPTNARWSVANPANTGDAIRLAEAYGAALDLMDDAWWGPVSLPPDMEEAFFHVAERSLPGSILVNRRGKRFVNEAAPYIDVVHTMYRLHRDDDPHIPAYFIFDATYRRRYLFGTLFPAQPLPRAYQGTYIYVAPTLRDLAQAMGIDPDGLEATVKRFNAMARAGRDEDFHRGESAYDRYYGDPTVRPNPNLAPIERPPFYGVVFYPGDIGTKGGLVTDEHARVLRTDGSVIDGLYATGNTAASVMGHSYPGAGATLAPAMVFGYVAALHAARRTTDHPSP